MNVSHRVRVGGVSAIAAAAVLVGVLQGTGVADAKTGDSASGSNSSSNRGPNKATPQKTTGGSAQRSASRATSKSATPKAAGSSSSQYEQGRGPNKTRPGDTAFNDVHTRSGAEPDRGAHKTRPGDVSTSPHAQSNGGHADFRDRSPNGVSSSGAQSAKRSPSASQSAGDATTSPSIRSRGGRGTMQTEHPDETSAAPQPGPSDTTNTWVPTAPKEDQSGNEWIPTTNPATGETHWDTTTDDGTSYTAGPHYDRHSVDPDGFTQVVTRDKDGTMTQVAVVDPRTGSGTGKILIDNEWRDTTFDGDYRTATVAGRWVHGKGPYDSKADITVNADGGYTVDTTVKGNARSASPGATAYRDIVTEAPDRTVTKVEVVDVHSGQRREVPIDPEFGEELHDIADKVLDIGDYPAKGPSTN